MKLNLRQYMKNLWVNTDQFIDIVQKVEKKISNQVVQSSKLLDVGREEKDFESFTLYSNTPDDHEDVRLYYEIVKT